MEVLHRIDDVKGRLEQPTPRPLDGQKAIDLTPRYEQPTLEEDDQP
ncbi:hypothetical protein [Streptomyces sp. NPDC007991]